MKQVKWYFALFVFIMLLACMSRYADALQLDKSRWEYWLIGGLLVLGFVVYLLILLTEKDE